MKASEEELPVKVSTRSGVRILTLNAPERRNALSHAMRKSLLGHLIEAGEDPAVRAIVLTGAGNAFCAGGDVREMSASSDMGSFVARQKLAMAQDCARVLIEGAKPTIAAVEGTAFGAGLSFAAACDRVVAGRGASFCAVFGKLGLVPDCGLLWTLPHRIGATAARDMLLTCEVIDAERAHLLGLVNHITEDGTALEKAILEAERYANAAPLAVASIKGLLSRHPASLDESLKMELDAQAVLLQSQDHLEARAAFQAKRKPMFRSR